ncbi:MAG: hypothetical protein IT287_02245 [Bdellovibrionaceae bacterium]|nr:hypothetical protein [Pseudobdellovibrionaceae bacterium]
MFLRTSVITTVIFLCAVVFAAPAIYKKDLSLPKGAEVKIVEFDTKNQMLKVSSVKFPGEDDSWLRMRDFSNSIQIDKGQEVRLRHEITTGAEKHLGQKFLLIQRIVTYVK